MSTDPAAHSASSTAASVTRRAFFGGCTAVVAGFVVAACGGGDSGGATPATSDSASPTSGGTAPPASSSGTAAPASSSGPATSSASAAGDGPRLDGLTIDVRRDVGCGCCLSWVSYLGDLGATVNVTEDAERVAYRAEVGIPEEAASCHTGVVDGYAIEGHVPAEAIVKMLADKPDGAGIALPGMPGDSPGMGGDAATWAAQKVVLVGSDGTLSDYAY